MQPEKYPILEFDPDKRAIIEPSEVIKPVEVSEYCVLCFFKDVVDKAAKQHQATIVFEDKGVYGTNPFYQFEYDGQSMVFFNPLVGAPLAAAFLEEAIALGCRKFIACGSAGVLDRDVAVGHMIIPDSAIRDEGVSYHYLPPGRCIEANKKALKTIGETLDDRGVPYKFAKTWTTDAMFRETRAKVKQRKEEGCLTVEMEAAALFAVAQFRGVELGYMLFGGDDVSGEIWDRREEKSRGSITEKIFWLSVEACLRL